MSGRPDEWSVSTDPDDVDEMVVLVGGEDPPEELHQLCLLSDRERPGIHVDALRLHGLTEGVLVRVVLELGLGDVLFDKDVRLPGGDDAGVVLQVGDGDGAELVVPVMREVLCFGPDDLQGWFVDGLTDVLGELSDRSADLDPFFSGVVVVLGNIQGLQDQPGLLGDKGDKGFTTLLRRVVDSDDRDQMSGFFSRMLDVSDSWHWLLSVFQDGILEHIQS